MVDLLYIINWDLHLLFINILPQSQKLDRNAWPEVALLSLGQFRCEEDEEREVREEEGVRKVWGRREEADGCRTSQHDPHQLRGFPRSGHSRACHSDYVKIVFLVKFLSSWVLCWSVFEE